MKQVSKQELEISGLQEQLRRVELAFERELRARGFDPAQADNVALTSKLAKLYEEREALKIKMASLSTEILTEDGSNE